MQAWSWMLAARRSETSNLRGPPGQRTTLSPVRALGLSSDRREMPPKAKTQAADEEKQAVGERASRTRTRRLCLWSLPAGAGIGKRRRVNSESFCWRSIQESCGSGMWSGATVLRHFPPKWALRAPAWTQGGATGAEADFEHPEPTRDLPIRIPRAITAASCRPNPSPETAFRGALLKGPRSGLTATLFPGAV